MKIINLDNYKKKWIDKLSFNMSLTEKFGLYIANPFCEKKCSFCIYRSKVCTENSILYENYYNKFLYNNIINFKDIIDIKTPDFMYFGGGTPSLMNHNTMIKIFSLFSNINEIKFKCFEANPNSLSKKKIDVLSEFQFDEVSLGVQTFNYELAKKYNRYNCSLEIISELVNYAMDKKIKTNVDIMAFLDYNLDIDLNRLKNDLRILKTNLNIAKITIYPYYSAYTKADINNKLNMMKKLKDTIREFCVNLNFSAINDSCLSTNEIDILKYGLSDYHLYNNSIDYLKLRRYNCSGPGKIPSTQNILSFGGYLNHIPYSYIKNEGEWFNVNIDGNLNIVEESYNKEIKIDDIFSFVQSKYNLTT